LDAGVEQPPEWTASRVEPETTLSVLPVPEVDPGNPRDVVFTGPDSLPDDWSADDELALFRSSAGSPEALDFSWPELADLIHGSDELL
jgi:hypothetical protein